MRLHQANTEDGYMLWGAFFKGRRNDGDGGLDIYKEWFTVARTGEEARRILRPLAEAHKLRFTGWYEEPQVQYRAVSPRELVLCSKRSGGGLCPLVLVDESPEGFDITPALMDTRE